MRSFWLTLAILPVLAQSSSQDPIIRVSVDLVQIDATVTDSAGRHVADLRPEDFVILEDGKPQTVTHFSYVAGQLASLAATAPKVPAVQPSKTAAIAPILTPAKPIAATQVRRTIVLIADDLGLSADDIPNTRTAMKAWIDREMEPGDMLSVVTTSGGIGAMEQLTNDRARLYAAIDRIHFALGRVGLTWYEPTNIVYIEAPRGSRVGMESYAQIQTGSNALLNAIRNPIILNESLSAVAYAIDGLRNMPGRKAIALFSDGFGQSPNGLVQLANRASVVIYTLDPRGVPSFFLTAADHCECGLRAGTALIGNSEHSRYSAFRMSQKGMEQLAAGTGGTFFHDNNDLTHGLSGVLADMSGYYLIGYQPQRVDFDPIRGAVPFHKIQVRVRRPGLTVRSRNGFYGTPDAPPPPAGNPLMTALRSPFQADGIPVYLSAFYSSSALRAILMVDARELKREDLPSGEQRISLDVLGGLWDGDDKQIARIDQTYSLEKTSAEMDAAVRSGLAVELDIPAAKPGPYQVRAAVRAVNTGLLGSASSFIQIPDYRRHRISMSSVLLSDNDAGRAELLEARGVIGAGSPAMRIFGSGATLNYVTEIFGAKARVDIQVNLYRGPEHIFTGKPIVLATAAENPHHAVGTVKLPDFLPPGDYALELTAFDGEAGSKRPHVSQWVDFRLVDTKAPTGEPGAIHPGP